MAQLRPRVRSCGNTKQRRFFQKIVRVYYSHPEKILCTKVLNSRAVTDSPAPSSRSHRRHGNRFRCLRYTTPHSPSAVFDFIDTFSTIQLKFQLLAFRSFGMSRARFTNHCENPTFRSVPFLDLLHKEIEKFLTTSRKGAATAQNAK